MKFTDKEITERNWKKMRGILDKEMPQKPKRRVFGYYHAAVAASLSLLFYFSLRQISPTIQHQTIPALAQSNDAQPAIHETATELVLSDQTMVTICNSQKENTRQLSQTVNQNNDPEASQESLPQGTSHLATMDGGIKPQQTIYAPEALTSHHDATTVVVQTSTNESVQIEELPNQSNNQRSGTAVAELEPHAPNTLAAMPKDVHLISPLPIFVGKKDKMRLGLTAQLGTHILPLPSSATLGLTFVKPLNNRIDLALSLGIDHIFTYQRAGSTIEITEQDINAYDLTATTNDFIKDRTAKGAFPKLERAQFLHLLVGAQKRLGSRWSVGLNAKYLYLTALDVAAIDKSTSALPVFVTQEINSAYDDLAARVLNRSSFAVQFACQYALTKRMSLGIASQNVLTKSHPEPASLHLTALYCPIRF
jgi:hypothetical protein